MRVKQKYYRGNYLIGIYTADELEQCIAVLDNLHEFAEFMNSNLDYATYTLHRIWNKKQKGVLIGHQKYLIYFINNNDF